MSEDWSYVWNEIGKSTKEGSKTFDKPWASSLQPRKELLIHCWKFIGGVWFVVMCHHWCDICYDNVTLKFLVYFIFSNITII